MSLNDPVVLEKSPKWGYYLTRGRETFYDKERRLISFETPADAIAWADENLGVPVVESADAEGCEEILEETWPKDQMKLL